MQVFHSRMHVSSLFAPRDHWVNWWRKDWFLWRLIEVCIKWARWKPVWHYHGNGTYHPSVQRWGNIWCCESENFKWSENVSSTRTRPVSRQSLNLFQTLSRPRHSESYRFGGFLFRSTRIFPNFSRDKNWGITNNLEENLLGLRSTVIYSKHRRRLIRKVERFSWIPFRMEERMESLQLDWEKLHFEFSTVRKEYTLNSTGLRFKSRGDYYF